jgi:hypothetical protein
MTCTRSCFVLVWRNVNGDPDEARDAGMRITARCGWGRREAMKTVRECKASIRLDLDTLIWTSGGRFPDFDAGGPFEMFALRIAAGRLAL